MYEVRVLAVADADDYRRVRLDALRLHPDAFGSAYEDEAMLERSQIIERLAAPGFTRYGGFAGDDLVGLAGLQMRTGCRRSGTRPACSACTSRLLIEAAGWRNNWSGQSYAGARAAGALVLQLSVAAGNAPAQRLYRSMGFTVYGVERRSLKVGDRFHDEELMALDLD